MSHSMSRVNGWCQLSVSVCEHFLGMAPHSLQFVTSDLLTSSVHTDTHSLKKHIYDKKFINYLSKFESGYHPGIIKERWLGWVQLISDLTHLFWLKYLQLWQLISRNKSKVCTAKHMQIMYCVFIKWKHFESTLCPSQCSWSRMEQIKTKVFKTMPKIVVSS